MSVKPPRTKTPRYSLAWIFPLLALLISPPVHGQSSAQKNSVTDPDWQQFCVARLLANGRGEAPVPDCLKAFGIADLSASSQKAWLDTLLRRSDAWDRLCLHHFVEWAIEAGFAPPPRGNAGWSRFSSPESTCRDAFVTTMYSHDRAAGSTPKESLDGILKLTAMSQAYGRDTSGASIKLISAPPLDRYYPKSSLRAGEQGLAVASCLIDQHGRPRACMIVQSSSHPALDDATLRMVPEMLFQVLNIAPGAAIRTKIPVRWSL